MGKIREIRRKFDSGSLREPAVASAAMSTHTEFRPRVESVKNRRNPLAHKGLLLQISTSYEGVLIMLEEREKVATIVTIVP